MVTNIFIQIIQDLETMGLLDVILPFLLFFVILFAILQKTKVLGSTLGKNRAGKPVQLPRKQFNVVVALVIALMVVVPHVTMNSAGQMDNAFLENGWPDAVVIVNKSLPQISTVIVAIIMVMLLIGIAGPNINIAGTPLVSGMAIISGIIVVGIFVMSLLDTVPGWIGWLEDYLPILVVIFVFGLIISFITKEPSKDTFKKKIQRGGHYLTGVARNKGEAEDLIRRG